MQNTFAVPERMKPVIFPTEPTLRIDELKIIDAVINNRKKQCDFMVAHTNAEYTVQFHVTLEEGRCFTYKGFSVVNS